MKRILIAVLLLAAVESHAAVWTFDFAGEQRTAGEYQRALPGLTMTTNGFTLGRDCDDCQWIAPGGAPLGYCLNGWDGIPPGSTNSCGPMIDPSDSQWNQHGNFSNEPTPGRVLSPDNTLMSDPVCAKPYLHFSRIIKWVRITYSSSTWECSECQPGWQCCYMGALYYPGHPDYPATMWGCRHAGGGCAWNPCAGILNLDQDGGIWTGLPEGSPHPGDPNGDYYQWHTAEMSMPIGADYLLFNINAFTPHLYGNQRPIFYIGKIEVSDYECPNPPCEFEGRAKVARGDGKEATPAARMSWGRLKQIYR